MGNVNGSVSGAVEDIDGDDNSVREGTVASDRVQVGYYPPGASSDSMGQSPSQVRIVPVMRHDDMHMPAYPSMQNAMGNNDEWNEQGIPTMITWSYGGKEVAVEGSWDGWKSRSALQRSGKAMSIMKIGFAPKTLGNNANNASECGSSMDIPPPLSRPQHVVLNHL